MFAENATTLPVATEEISQRYPDDNNSSQVDEIADPGPSTSVATEFALYKDLQR